MDDEVFNRLVGEALDSLPKEFAEKLDNVGVVVEESPTIEHLKSANVLPRSLLFGLYQGVPITKRTNYTNVLPDKITIFKNPILYVSRTEDDVRKQVRSTVMHEIGHHFGMSEEQLQKT